MELTATALVVDHETFFQRAHKPFAPLKVDLLMYTVVFSDLSLSICSVTNIGLSCYISIKPACFFVLLFLRAGVLNSTEN